ncbi:hypothetical protein PG994_004277 [Apiospora phragmitis]|uniref:Uncharacterized protein n=1 Tax=Apiospora phragmitis TaxID=2905665 RepID=A0ABR1VQ53_9PEZI
MPVEVDTVDLAPGVRFTQSVVAVCDNQDERAAMNDIEPMRTFKFYANYNPKATVLFRLSIAFSKEETLYLELTPSVIESLEKNTCDEQDDNRPRCFDTIKRLLNGHTSFTRLQFHLRSPGRFIVPSKFDRSRLADGTNPTSALIIYLAAASTFSLYMPQNALPKTKCDTFLEAVKTSSAMTEGSSLASERMTDLRTIYNGKGGELLSIEDQDCLRRSISGGVVPTIAADLLSYVRPPDYPIEEQNSLLLPSSQESTASKSDDATVAVPTPPPYRSSYEKHGSEKPGDAEGRSGHLNKRYRSSDNEHNKLSKRRVLDTQSMFTITSLGPVESTIRALQERIEKVEAERKRTEAKLESRIEELEAQVEEQQNEIAMLQKDHEGVKYDQERTADDVDTLCTKVDELAQDHDTLKESWVESGKESLRDDIYELIKQCSQESADSFLAGIKKQMRRALED